MKTLARIILIALIAGIGATAATGFGGDWFFGRMSGWLLMAHLAAAPLVLGGAAVAAVLWGRAHRFDADGTMRPLRKVGFWLLLACVLAVGGTMLMAMFPVLGTREQAELLEWHERAGLGVVIFGAIYLGLCVVKRTGKGDAR